MQNLTPAEKTASRERKWSSTALSRLSGPYQERKSHNLSTEDGLETRGEALYESTSNFEKTSTITNPRVLNANDLSSISSLSSSAQAVAMTHSLSTGVYQETSPVTTTYATASRVSSSSFTFDEISNNNNNNNNNNSDPLGLYPFPQPHSFDMLTGSVPATTFDQFFTSFDYGDALAYPASLSAFHDERIIRELRTEPLPPYSSPKRQCGPLGVLNTHPFSPQQEEKCTPSMPTTEIQPRSIKPRLI